MNIGSDSAETGVVADGDLFDVDRTAAVCESSEPLVETEAVADSFVAVVAAAD